MRRTERIVFTLGALGEARQATPLAQRMDPVSPARQNLVRITLMTYVPDQNVPRRVEHIVDCCRKLHHTQTRTKMTACLRDRVHRRVAQLVRQLTQITLGQTTQIRRIRYTVQQWRLRVCQNVLQNPTRACLVSAFPLYDELCHLAKKVSFIPKY